MKKQKQSVSLPALVLLCATLLGAGTARAETTLYASTNSYASIAISDEDRITSLVVGGRELVRTDWDDHLIRFNDRDGWVNPLPKMTSPSNGFFVAEFASPAATVKFHVEAKDYGWIFCLDSVSSTAGIDKLFFACIRPACRCYGGGEQNMLNMMSDDTHGVVLLPLSLNAESSYCTTNTGLHVFTGKTCGYAPARAGLVAGTRAQMPKLLDLMRPDSGAPFSAVGGPRARSARINRGSYIFAYLDATSIDDWIELARRAGFTMIHVDESWTSSFGSYIVRKESFPNGLSDLVAAARKTHAAGLNFGLHTYTGGVNPTDPLAARFPKDLLAWSTCSLAASVDATAGSLAVSGSGAYASEGNYLRVDDEIMTYSNFSNGSYTGLKRGACGTRAAAHAAGASVAILAYHYGCFSAIGDSPLAWAVGAAMSNVVAATAANEVYFDAADMGTRLNVDTVRRTLFRAIGRDDIQIEAACEGYQNWWYHSQLGAWDQASWGIKRLIDHHIAYSAPAIKADLMPVQTGWFGPCKSFPVPRSYGVFEDDMDYLGVKGLANGLATSIQSVSAGRGGYLSVRDANEPYSLCGMTVLGWYERARLADAVDAPTRARLAVPGDEFILRQQPDGAWRFQPLQSRKHRVNVYGNGSESWTVTVPEPAKARLRVLAMLTPVTNKAAAVLVSAENAVCAASSSGSGIAARVVPVNTPYGHGFGLAAANISGENGGWAAATCTPKTSFDRGNNEAFGMWVKGDGKGERLAVELVEAPWSASVHVFDIDFTGWRYLNFHFYERDPDLFSEDVWPYGDCSTLYTRGLYLNPVSGRNFGRVVFALARLPKDTACRITVSPVMSYATGSCLLKDASVIVNGVSVPVPFPLASGEFAELDGNGWWTRYNKFGQELQAVRDGAALPALKSGANAVSLAAANATPEVPLRAEVTLFAEGRPFGAVKAATAASSAILDREYALPAWYSVPGGATKLPPLLVRPGRECRLELTLTGHLDHPVLVIDGAEYAFETSGWSDKDTDQLICADGENWILYTTGRKVLATGKLAKPLPKLSGGAHALALRTGPSGQSGWVNITKGYFPE